jgi:ribosomal protein S18 acetylase RimI-like enzyme
LGYVVIFLIVFGAGHAIIPPFVTETVFVDFPPKNSGAEDPKIHTDSLNIFGCDQNPVVQKEQFCKDNKQFMKTATVTSTTVISLTLLTVSVVAFPTFPRTLLSKNDIRKDTQQTPATATRMTKSNKYETQEAEVVIRSFQDEDIEQIQRLFEGGMFSILPAYARAYLKRIMLFRCSFAGWTSIAYILHPLVATPVMCGLQYAACIRRQPALPVTSDMMRTACLSVATTVLGWTSHCYWFASKAFRDYVNKTCQREDLADAKNVKSEYGTDGGCFLVATLMDSKNGDKIVGCVGGKFTSLDKAVSLNDTTKSQQVRNRVYELKRMSVDSRYRGRGIASKLLQRLEQDLDDASKIFLYSSNFQYPAHALYRKAGFQLISQSRPSATGFSLWKWEKLYGDRKVDDCRRKNSCNETIESISTTTTEATHDMCE